jgi:hypothetical protein
MNRTRLGLGTLILAAAATGASSWGGITASAPWTWGPIGRGGGRYGVLRLRELGLAWAGDGVKPRETRQMRRHPHN